MKCVKIILIMLCAVSVSASAAIIASDDFSYADGPLTGNSGGTGWAGGYTDGGNSLAVASSQIDEGGGPGEVGINFRVLSNTINTTNYPGGEIWVGFDGQLTLEGAWGFGGISPFEGGSEKGIIGATTGRDMFGIGGNDTGVTGTNHIIVKFDLITNAVSLWAAPVGDVVDVSATAPTQTGSMNINGTDNLRFALNSTDAGGNIQIDNLVLATTAAEVGSRPVATGPDPDNGESDVNINLLGLTVEGNLSWDASIIIGATYDIYFGTTVPNELEADYGLTQIGTAGQPDTSAAPTLPLINSTQYWWVVDIREPNALAPGGYDVLPGNAWSFTTIAPEPIITAEPVNETAASVDLVVEAANAEVYEWYRVGTPAAVQTTGTLGVPGAASDTYNTSTEGFYYCVISNTIGSATSEIVRVMTPRLVGHWKLDGDLTDSSVAGIWDGDYIDPNELQPNPDDSTVVYVEGADGIAGHAVKFNGYNVIEIPDSNEFFNFHPQGLTLTAWLLGPSGGDWHRAVDKTDSYGIIQQDSNSILLQIDTQSWREAVPSAEGGEGKWRFVAMTYDPASGQQTVYSVYDDTDVIDILHQTTYDISAPSSEQNHLRIGGRSPNSLVDYFYEGSVDDVRVYNYAVSPEDIAQMYYDVAGHGACLNLPEYDFTGDCQVNLLDFAKFAEDWTSCGLYPTCISTLE